MTIPSEHRRSLGIIGAGSIVDVAHLPAYRKAGLEVVAIVDRWEQMHQRRLLSTTEAGTLAQLIADSLESAYDRGSAREGRDARRD